MFVLTIAFSSSSLLLVVYAQLEFLISEPISVCVAKMFFVGHIKVRSCFENLRKFDSQLVSDIYMDIQYLRATGARRNAARVIHWKGKSFLTTRFTGRRSIMFFINMRRASIVSHLPLFALLIVICVFVNYASASGDVRTKHQRKLMVSNVVSSPSASLRAIPQPADCKVEDTERVFNDVVLKAENPPAKEDCEKAEIGLKRCLCNEDVVKALVEAGADPQAYETFVDNCKEEDSPISWYMDEDSCRSNNTSQQSPPSPPSPPPTLLPEEPKVPAEPADLVRPADTPLVGQRVDCSGAWVDCELINGQNCKTYRIKEEASQGGELCPYGDGEKDCNSCSQPVDCVGSWGGYGACSANKTCRKYTITQSSAYGGTACPFASDAEQCTDCVSPAPPVDCIGGWGAYGNCEFNTEGKNNQRCRTYKITTLAAVGGTKCPYADGEQECLTEGCSQPVDCVGSWGAYGACLYRDSAHTNVRCRTYSHSRSAISNGVECPFPDSRTECTAVGCEQPIDCIGKWSTNGACVYDTGLERYQTCQTYTITRAAARNGYDCPYAPNFQRCSNCDSISTFPQSTPGPDVEENTVSTTSVAQETDPNSSVAATFDGIPTNNPLPPTSKVTTFTMGKPVSVTEKFAGLNADDFIDNEAAQTIFIKKKAEQLGIDPIQIKIVNVTKGSVIIDYLIFPVLETSFAINETELERQQKEENLAESNINAANLIASNVLSNEGEVLDLGDFGFDAGEILNVKGPPLPSSDNLPCPACSAAGYIATTETSSEGLSYCSCRKPAEEDSEQLSVGAIAGIAVGCVVFVAAAGAGSIFAVIHHRRGLAQISNPDEEFQESVSAHQVSPNDHGKTNLENLIDIDHEQEI